MPVPCKVAASATVLLVVLLASLPELAGTPALAQTAYRLRHEPIPQDAIPQEVPQGIAAPRSLGNGRQPGTGVSLQEPTLAALGNVNVMIDRAKVVRLPQGAQTVIIGNPIVADINVQRNGVAIVTGKSFGITNIIALDQAGNMLAEANLRVEAPQESLVTVQRGADDRQTYSCLPNCQPTVALGDSPKYLGEVIGAAGQRNAAATPAAPSR